MLEQAYFTPQKVFLNYSPPYKTFSRQFWRSLRITDFPAHETIVVFRLTYIRLSLYPNDDLSECDRPLAWETYLPPLTAGETIFGEKKERHKFFVGRVLSKLCYMFRIFSFCET